LFPLVFPEDITGISSDVNSMSLPDAIRLVVSASEHPLSARDMQLKLDELGFDLKKFDNPLANILTAMKRMVDSGELVPFDGDKKRVVKGPE